ncbi:Retrotransposable element Tf2 protein type 2, partial [Aphis craccivora]
MLFTDNAALRWLQQARCTNSKLTRWALQLGLSILKPAGTNTVDEESLENNIHDPPVIRPGVSRETSGVFGDLSGVPGGSDPKRDDGNVLLHDVREWQLNDPNIREIIAKLSGDGARFRRLSKLYVIRDKVLHRHPRSIGSGEEEKRGWLFQLTTGMREAVRNYVRACDVCARIKPLNRKPENRMYTRVPRQLWDVLSIDLMGPYPRTGGSPRDDALRGLTPHLKQRPSGLGQDLREGSHPAGQHRRTSRDGRGRFRRPAVQSQAEQAEVQPQSQRPGMQPPATQQPIQQPHLGIQDFQQPEPGTQEQQLAVDERWIQAMEVAPGDPVNLPVD